ncbi:MAG: glycosyltransferase [Clostridiaceae bacterium]
MEEIIQFLSKIKNDNLVLLIVGDGPHRHKLEQYAKDVNVSDNVIFTGMISPSEVNFYYQLGDVFVSASTSETQGLTYIEALGNGIPALCRKDSCLDNVIIDGINGWQYISFDQFNENLDLMLNDKELYRTLSGNAIAGVAQYYSSSAFAKRIESIYLHVIEKVIVDY